MARTIEDIMVQQAVDIAILSGMLRLGKMRCICPEISVGPGRIARSTGGETTQSWKHRDKDRKDGKDVPFGGCLCDIGNDVMAVVDTLVVSAES